MIQQIISAMQRTGWIIIDFSGNDATIRIVGNKDVEQVLEIDVSAKCFDLIAKNKDMTLIIKYIDNIDNFSKEKSEELLNIAHIFNSVPLIIGERNRNGNLENNILYNRYQINALNFTTFASVLEKKEFPRVYSQRGGYFVQIKTKEFKELRQSRNLSLADIAKKLKLTPKAVYEYESNNMKTRLAHFEEMARIFKFSQQEFLRQFSETIDIFVKLYKSNYETIRDLVGFQQEIDHRLTELGFITYWFNKAPIDMSFEDATSDRVINQSLEKEKPLAESRNIFISEISSVKEAGASDLARTIKNTEKKLEKHVAFLKEFGKVLETKCNMVVLLDDQLFQDLKHVHGIPIIHEHEIPSNAEKLKKIILDRKHTS
ncbi:MAG: helix-turn-helix domain-containing protein [Candidatus Sigynarchaeota archaeon]